MDGILLDLGVSSYQIDEEKRGFSYIKDSPLDMRMDRTQSLTAEDVVNDYKEENLANIIYEYGEERFSRQIAKKICEERKKKRITKTLELAEIIKNNVPISYRNKSNPCRKTFQAIRIEVNNELGILENSLLDAFELLKPKGRLCVITFHSLEDRIVKNVFKKLSSDDEISKKLPVVPENMKRKANLITKKPIIPTKEELELNKRSISAKLRIIEKI